MMHLLWQERGLGIGNVAFLHQLGVYSRLSVMGDLMLGVIQLATAALIRGSFPTLSDGGLKVGCWG